MNPETQHRLTKLKNSGAPLREIWRFILESPRYEELKEDFGGDREVHLWNFLIASELEHLWKDPVLLPEEKELPSWKTIVRLSPVSEFRLKVLTLWHQSPFSAPEKLPVFFEFLEDPDSTIRLYLLQILNEYEVNFPEATSYLLRCLSQENSLPVQLSLLHILEKLAFKNATSFIPLLSKLLEEENGQLQYKIVEVLGKWNVPETLPLLEKAMKSSETYVRLAAEKFLQKRGIVSQKPQKRFSTILEMKDWHARAEAVLILAESSEILMERENFLLQILSQDENLYVRVSAITALAKFPKSEPILSSLKIALSDSSDLVRSAVIQTWGKMPISSEDVLSLFPSLLKDVSASVRFSAVKLIGFLGVDTPEIRAILTQHILSDPECNVRQMAIKVLSCFLPPQEQIQQTLQKAFQDPRAEVRAIAILGFHKQWTPEVDFLCILKPFLEDENEQVRKATLLSLNEFKLSSKKMLEILDSFLEEESDWNVQITAIEILASFSEPQEKIIERLYKTLMKDPEEEVKLEAIVALKKMGENFRIKPILQKLVKSGNPVLRASAKKLLEDLS